jgi:hypothetical protein
VTYREFEIEAFEVGRGQWHARFRRTDRALTVIDGIEFEVLNVGFAWSTDDAALNDAQHVIDRMRTSRLIQGMQR